MRVSLVLALALLGCSSSPDTGLFGAAEVTGSGGESASSGGAQTGGTAPLGTGGSTATGGAVGTGGFAIAPGWTETGGYRTTGPWCGVDGGFCRGGTGGLTPGTGGIANSGGANTSDSGTAGGAETGGTVGTGGAQQGNGGMPCVAFDAGHGCGDPSCQSCAIFGAYANGAPTCLGTNGLNDCWISCDPGATPRSRTSCGYP